MQQIQGVNKVYELDVSSEESVKNLRKNLEEENIKINGIINNAGIFTKKSQQNEDCQASLFSTTTELFTTHFQVNTLGELLHSNSLSTS